MEGTTFQNDLAFIFHWNAEKREQRLLETSMIISFFLFIAIIQVCTDFFFFSFSTITMKHEMQSNFVSLCSSLISSGGLPTRPTRPGLGAPKAQGPPRLGGSKVGGLQGSPAQWPQRAGVHKAWKSPWVGPQGLAPPMVWGPPWVGGPMGWGPQRILGCVYEAKPIIAVLFSLVWFRFVQRMQS
jgi:hypothetical protein